MSTVTDRIEKKITLRAPVSRVWRAVSDAREFGAWFGVKFDGPFVAGARVTGRITPTTVDPEVAKLQEPHTGKAFDFTVDRIEPERLFSFRWHPFAVEPGVDYSKEPATLVVFELTEVEGGTLLTISESGFDRIPLERRAKAFAANEGGWEHQTKLIAKYVLRQAG
ncbi:SRPBCC family protein [Vitiosangium sp. GDMCC 1.1324]|uniref:SRPBCC family protein n=1 Tax=Vitiosangium sp. (strain GDMCC 1.1324) TaxID=2138576 RepID=UPI000D3616FF|nr:SRPBCC family protein [Vitiosangium sp. GDMCC 1.1324]PTL82008.1 vanillate O-demethylase oxidoreductase VanB [Vitiosangium sp. GDMCC 1.1324]